MWTFQTCSFNKLCRAKELNRTVVLRLKQDVTLNFQHWSLSQRALISLIAMLLISVWPNTFCSSFPWAYPSLSPQKSELQRRLGTCQTSSGLRNITTYVTPLLQLTSSTKWNAIFQRLWNLPELLSLIQKWSGRNMSKVKEVRNFLHYLLYYGRKC